MQILLLLIIGYFIGSIPSGLLIVRWKTGRDVRTMGSGNMGATNVRRAAGNRAALATLICDMLKGMLPVLAAIGVTNSAAAAAAAALAAVGGHMYPAYLGFRPSGKGVATALGAYLAVAPTACTLALLIFLGVTVVTRRVSAGSLCAVAALPVFVWLTTGNYHAAGSALAAAVLIIFRHGSNIGRLLNGTEPKL